MNTVIVKNCKTLFIGRHGENKVTEVLFDFSEWQEQFGAGVIDLYVKRNLDIDAYPVVLSVDGTVATWLVSAADTDVVGNGKIEYVYTVNEKIAKSAIFQFFVGDDIGESSPEPPEHYQSWLEQLTELGAETQANAQAAAQSASEAAESASEAAESAAQVAEDSNNAEAWAVGERNGEPVSEGDPTYDNNAKYWAENARANAPVQSVNGEDGDVVLTLDDIPNGETYVRTTPEQLAQIATNSDDIADVKATADTALQPDDLRPYRTAAAQDAIDQSQNTMIGIAIHGKQAKITASGILKGDGAGGVSSATAGTDYATPQQVSDKYTKPSDGIPSTDMTAAVQASLSKADSALQAVPDTYRTAADQDLIDNGKQAKITASGILKGDGAGGVSAAVAGVDYLKSAPVTSVNGQTGDVTIQTATDAQVTTAVNTWLGENVAQETGYVLDASLTMSNAAPPASAVGDLKSAFNADLVATTWTPNITKGSYFKVADGATASSNKYARTSALWNGYGTRKAIVVDDPTYEFCLALYDETGTTSGTGYLGYIGYATGTLYIPQNAKLFGISFRRVDQAALADSDITAISAALSAFAATDTTLSVAGASADAKATGDRLSAVSSAVSNMFITNVCTESDFTQGMLHPQHGWAISSTTRIKSASNIQAININSISVPTGYKFAIFAYRTASVSEESYLGYYNDGSLAKTNPIPDKAWQRGTFLIPELLRNVYIRIAVAYEDDSNISVDAASNVTLTLFTDTSLTVAGVPADAKAVGDSIQTVRDELPKSFYSESVEDFFYDVGMLRPNNGAVLASTTRLRLREAMATPDNILSVRVNSGYKFLVFVYSNRDSGYQGYYSNGSLIKTNPIAAASWCIDKIDIPSEFKGQYLKLVVAKTDDSAIARSDAENLIIDYDAHNKPIKHEISFGRKNAQASARQMGSIKWTPILPIPMTNSAGYVEAGTECIGLPYSSTASLCKYIGQHLTYYTFMTALQNPRSVLYTRVVRLRPLGKTYYGITCFTFTSFPSGSRLGCFDNEITRMYNGDNVEISPYEIEPGDALMLIFTREEDHDYNHCILIYDVSRDKYGRITSVQLAEATPPFAVIHQPISFDDFLNGYIYGGHKYKVYRKTDRTDYGAYEAVAGVCGYPDEETSIETYPDIMPEYGDKACVEAGTDVVINVINPRTYNEIEIFKDDVLQQTITTIADFTMSNIAYGKYKFVISGDGEQSESYLIVADINASYNAETGVVTFSSANATPVFIASYNRGTGVQNIVKYLSEAEINNGEASTANVVGALYKGVEVGFLTEYGVAMWLSDRDQFFAPEWEPFVAP